MGERIGEDRPGAPADAERAATEQTLPVGPAPLGPLPLAPGRAAARRAFLLRFGIAFGVIVLSFIATVIILNSTIYSAKGFGDAYLAALSRHDVDTAIQTPGVELPDDAADDLLAPDALGELAVIRLLDDQTGSGGDHRLTYEIDLDGTRSKTTLTVAPAGTTLGLFPSWRFGVSPTAVLEVTAQSASEFEANGVTAVAVGGPGVASAFRSLVPAAYALGQDAELYSADARQVVVTAPGQTTPALIEAQASTRFVELVQDQLDALLDDCVTQQILQPTDCPFGQTIRDRIVTPPTWSMATYPAIVIMPAATPGTWLVPRTVGAAHIVVDVRSLFDGTVTTLDEDVPFEVGYTIRVGGDGTVDIQPG